MKKKLSIFLAVVTILSLLCPAVFAAGANAGDVRIVVGADLTDAQKDEVYKFFNVARGSVTELTVNIDEERARLGSYVSADKIGSYSLSCVLLRVKKEGEGMDIRTNNITWCTSDMYKNALLTSGITDAEVVITAPYAVSGTAALTGLYKAYEDITGTALNETAKDAAAEELVVTGNLAQSIGSEEATELINQLKLILDETKDMSDSEVVQQIRSIADEISVQLTDEEESQILQLIRKLEKLDIGQLRETVMNAFDKFRQIEASAQKAAGFAEKVGAFFRKLSDFFTKLFGSAAE